MSTRRKTKPPEIDPCMHRWEDLGRLERDSIVRMLIESRTFSAHRREQSRSWAAEKRCLLKEGKGLTRERRRHLAHDIRVHEQTAEKNDILFVRWDVLLQLTLRVEARLLDDSPVRRKR